MPHRSLCEVWWNFKHIRAVFKIVESCKVLKQCTVSNLPPSRPNIQRPSPEAGTPVRFWILVQSKQMRANHSWWHAAVRFPRLACMLELVESVTELPHMTTCCCGCPYRPTCALESALTSEWVSVSPSTKQQHSPRWGLGTSVPWEGNK